MQALFRYKPMSKEEKLFIAAPYLSSPHGKCYSATIKLSSRDAIDSIDQETSPCPQN
jgi:hypothetical protein